MSATFEEYKLGILGKGDDDNTIFVFPFSSKNNLIAVDPKVGDCPASIPMTMLLLSSLCFLGRVGDKSSVLFWYNLKYTVVASSGYDELNAILISPMHVLHESPGESFLHGHNSNA